MVKSLWATLVIGALLAVTFEDVAAQYEPWSLSMEAEGGLLFPVRAFGKNGQIELTDNPLLQPLQPSAKAQSSPIFGAGVRLQFPNPGMALRVTAYTTSGATVESRTPACDVLGPIDQQNDTFRCANPFVEDYRVTQMLARMSFKQGADTRVWGVAVEVGLGVRRYDFDGLSCPVNLTEEAFFICERADQLTADQTQPLVLFGFNVEYAPGPLGVFLKVQDQVSPYGGPARGEEEAQNDLTVSAGLNFKVR